MRRVGTGLAMALLLVGCSKLPTTGDGIVAIEITTPATLTLYQDSSVTLQGRALDQQGNEVAAALRWYTVDTAAVTVDSVLGIVTAKLGSGAARVQASVGTLRSTPVSLLLAPTPTTLIIPPQEH